MASSLALDQGELEFWRDRTEKIWLWAPVKLVPDMHQISFGHKKANLTGLGGGRSSPSFGKVLKDLIKQKVGGNLPAETTHFRGVKPNRGGLLQLNDEKEHGETGRWKGPL